MNIWLPYTQMKNAQHSPQIVSTHGSTLALANGTQLIDGIASWWSACHGYNHPAIITAIEQQLNKFSHVMLGGLLHEPATELASSLSRRLGHGLSHVFFSDSGSVAVEVALKMAVQYWQLQDRPKQNRFLYFQHAYHGDTFQAMAICDPEEGMHHRFRDSLTQHICSPLPTDDASKSRYLALLDAHRHEIAAIIVEPLVQGACGMKMHTPETLDFLTQAARSIDAIVIYDEIFTGFGRTGKFWAFEHSQSYPDIICLGKALTAGMLPMAATVANDRIYDAFLTDDPEDALMHGPTFMGNPLAASAGLASLQVFDESTNLQSAAQLGNHCAEALTYWQTHPKIRSIRSLGAILAIELMPNVVKLDNLRKAFLQHNVWIRPLPDCIYLTPAFTISESECQTLIKAIDAVLGQFLNG